MLIRARHLDSSFTEAGSGQKICCMCPEHKIYTTFIMANSDESMDEMIALTLTVCQN